MFQEKNLVQKKELEKFISYFQKKATSKLYGGNHFLSIFFNRLHHLHQNILNSATHFLDMFPTCQTINIVSTLVVFEVTQYSKYSSSLNYADTIYEQRHHQYHDLTPNILDIKPIIRKHFMTINQYELHTSISSIVLKLYFIYFVLILLIFIYRCFLHFYFRTYPLLYHKPCAVVRLNTPCNFILNMHGKYAHTSCTLIVIRNKFISPQLLKTTLSVVYSPC